MTMHANRFLAQFKTLKEHVAGESGSDELRHAFQRVVEAFKAAYSADTLKEALAGDSEVPTELEERITSALLLYNRERSLGGSHALPEAPESPAE